MKQTILIQVVVDDVELNDLDSILNSIQKVIEKYPDKRITTNIQDEPLIRQRPIR